MTNTERIADLERRLSEAVRDRDEWKEAAGIANAAIEHYQGERNKSDAYAGHSVLLLQALVEALEVSPYLTEEVSTAWRQAQEFLSNAPPQMGRAPGIAPADYKPVAGIDYDAPPKKDR